MAVKSGRPQPSGALEVLKKVLLSTSGEQEWEKKELISLLFFVKATIALGVGLACGILPVTGASGFLLYVVAVATLTFIFYHSILRIDEEEFGGHMNLISEDQNIAVPLFLLTWVLTFSSVWY